MPASSSSCLQETVQKSFNQLPQLNQSNGKGSQPRTQEVCWVRAVVIMVWVSCAMRRQQQQLLQKLCSGSQHSLL
jgi:hypothetical protein